MSSTTPRSPLLARTRQRDAMVQRLRDEGIDDVAVLDAMAEVPRERFVPSDLAAVAHDPHPLPIRGGQTISAPSMVGRMVAALELTGTERVLEIGTGSGYAAAILACCAGEVISVETDAGLAETAVRALAAVGATNVEVLHGDGSGGVPDRAPFDAISVTAMAPGRIPAALIDQLVDGGTLVCPVGHATTGQLLRHRAGLTASLGAVSFVPLRSSAAG